MTDATPFAVWPFGDMRAASGNMIDQKTACASATITRAASSVMKEVTQGITRWATAKIPMRDKRSFLRSSFAVAMAKGSEAIATTQA